MALLHNRGFEDGKVGDTAGAASSWSITTQAAVEVIAGYFSNGGNLLAFSDDFSNAVWSKLGGSAIAQVAQPNVPGAGGQPWELTDAAAGPQVHGVSEMVASFSGIPTDHGAVASVWARKVAGGPVDFLRITFEADDAYFDLANGTVGTVNGSGSASIVDEGAGWYRCILISSRSGAFSYTLTATGDDDAPMYTGTGVPVMLLFGPQVNVGLAVTPALLGAASQSGVLPFENFEALWDANESYAFDLDDVGSTVGLYGTLLTSTKAFENFEELWNTNEAYLFALGATTQAQYDAGTPENFEDFEDEWDANESFFFDLADVIAGPGLTTADYDPGGPAQLFEDFGDADPTLWNSGSTYHLTLASAGSTAALYDGAMDAFEDFEEEWALTSTTI